MSAKKEGVHLLIEAAKLKLKPVFPRGIPEEVLMWAIVERAIEDLSRDFWKEDAWIFLANCWAAEYVGIDADWLKETLVKIGLKPDTIEDEKT